MAVEHWTYSKHRAYVECPRQYWLTSVEKVPREDSSASIRGQVMHAGLALGWHASRAAYTTDDVIVAAMNQEADKLEARGARMDDEDFARWVETTLTALTHIGPRPGDTTLGVEYELTGEVEGIPVKVRLDLAYLRKREDQPTLTVRDWKSTSEIPTRDDLLRDTQLGLSALLAARHWQVTRVRVEIGSIGAAVVAGVEIPRETAQAAGARVAASARAAAADEEFRPRRSAVCAECKVRQFCPLFATGPVPDPGN